ncbi:MULTISPECIES: J domain-containing protein [Actinomyces]|uniref:J domain-containing protein n=1 Tax=Actinomyces respiraculi TaxID=2744574 RepID=A0A7T0PWU5_9ACTO|nr:MULTISPECIES: J domain-containing protein [Actinomyces]QPL04930.1 hypothetical protein ID810_09280 [Actinomyces respiraculi]
MSKNPDGVVDYYAELRLDRDSSRGEILSTLEKQMLEYQDRLEAHEDPELERRFELVLTALDVFSSDEERTEYDALLSPTPLSSESPAADSPSSESPVSKPMQPEGHAAAGEPPAADPQQTVSYWIDEAWQYFARGETDAAGQAAAKARSVDPSEPGAYVVSAWVAYGDGRGDLYGTGTYVGQARLLNEGGAWRGRLAWLQGRMLTESWEFDQKLAYFREAIEFLSGEEQNEARAELLRAYSDTMQRWDSKLLAEYQADFPEAEGGAFTKVAYLKVGEEFLRSSSYDAARYFLMATSPHLPGSVDVSELYERAAKNLNPAQVRRAALSANCPPNLGEALVEEAVARTRLPEQENENFIIRWIREWRFLDSYGALFSTLLATGFLAWATPYAFFSVVAWLSLLLILGFPIAAFVIWGVDRSVQSDFEKHKARVAHVLGSKD